MSASAIAVLGLVAWSVVLTGVLLGIRIAAIAGGKPMNQFDPSGKDCAPFGYRVTRAHGNSLENLAVNVAPMLYAIASGHAALTDPLANVVLGARIAQSLVHIASSSSAAVLLRGSFFGVQMGIALYWCWTLAHAA
jgi:uncharacterized MAPEG superfamily protein